MTCSEPTLSRWGDLAVEEVAYRGQPDVRVRPHVQAPGDAGLEGRRSEMVKEDEGADHPPRDLGQGPLDLEAAAEVVALGVQNQFDHAARSSSASEVSPA